MQPWRTVYNFCNAYEKGKQQLLQQWSQEEKYGGKTDNFSQLVNGFSTVAEEPSDLVNFFGKLDNVAPQDIEPDIVKIKNSFENDNNVMNTAAAGNFIGAAGQALVSGFQSMGAFERVNFYIGNNCDSGTYLKNSQRFNL